MGEPFSYKSYYHKNYKKDIKQNKNTKQNRDMYQNTKLQQHKNTKYRKIHNEGNINRASAKEQGLLLAGSTGCFSGGDLDQDQVNPGSDIRSLDFFVCNKIYQCH